MPELMGKLDTPVNGPEGLPRLMVTPGIMWTGGTMRSRYGGCGGRIFKAVQER